jgi:hypothetical protein
MESAVEMASDTFELPSACRSEGQPKKPVRSKKATKPQLLTRAVLDGRTNAAKLFDQLVANIQNDLGGRSELSAIELTLVEAYAGAAITLENLNTRLLLGEQINLSEHAQAVSAMVRVASRLGLQRRPRDVTLLDPLAYAHEHGEHGESAEP